MTPEEIRTREDAVTGEGCATPPTMEEEGVGEQREGSIVERRGYPPRTKPQDKYLL